MTSSTRRWFLGCWIFIVAAVGLGAAADAQRGLPPGPVGQLGLGNTHIGAVPDVSTVALPVSVQAPAVGINAALVPVGKTPDGALAVPNFGTAGWYQQSARPGAPGAAVLAGHVDSRTGPDVFYGLRKLQPGDQVTVHLADGTVRRFIVDGREQTPKDALPVSRVFDNPPTPELRLITCGGTFDRSTQHYDANVIVYAHLESA